MARILLDTLERALSETPLCSFVFETFGGFTTNYIQCLTCNYQSSRDEKFFDIVAQVSGKKGLEESLAEFFGVERMDKENQYFCEQCDKKCDADRGVKARVLPPVLTFSLMRFGINWDTGSRYKVNDRFEFPLELDMKPFLIADSDQINDDMTYELKAVVKHSGGTYGGHYNAYI